MGFRDRFYTPTTAKAILSGRILIGIGLGAALIVAGLNPVVSVVAGAAAYVGLVGAAMPKSDKRPSIDPFTLQEPWRRFVQQAQQSASRLHETIDVARDGPLKERMQAIGSKVDHGLDETWRIARRGHEIDAAVHRLDPTSLRSRLETLRDRAGVAPSDEIQSAIESLESQLASTVRLKEQSEKTANTLRLSQSRMDELAVRATEVSIGAGDTDAYEHDVEDLVIELEGLRQAVEETRTA